MIYFTVGKSLKHISCRSSLSSYLHYSGHICIPMLTFEVYYFTFVILFLEQMKMASRLRLVLIMSMYFYIRDRYVCAIDTITMVQGMKVNNQQNTKQHSNETNATRHEILRQKKIGSTVDNDMLTRMTNMETNMNELMLYVKDIIQINKENQIRLIEVKEVLEKKVDVLNGKFDVLENKHSILEKSDKSVINASHGMRRHHIDLSSLVQNIRDVKRAASLLTISKIKLADMPYMAHCDSNTEADVESYIDVCLQTRLEELYSDFDDVLNFHVMLVDGAGPHEGRVEIIYEGRHGTICDAKWNYKEARVVCKMLGYGFDRYGRAYISSYFGNGTGEILLDSMECTGEEGSLLACKHRGINGYDEVGSYCHHGRDAGVRCDT